MAKAYREDTRRDGNHAKERPQTEIERQAEQEYLLRQQSIQVVAELRRQGVAVKFRKERICRWLEVLPDPVNYGGYIGWKVR